jgi:predicted branched-subunit amino acid permease
LPEPAPAAPRSPVLEGARLIGTTAIGTTCWGLVTGVALVKGGLTPLQALGMVMLVFSGTAQLAALPLIAAGASLPAIWATALLANLRFVVYSALVAGEFREQPLRRRLLLGWLTTDTGLAAYLSGARPGTPAPDADARAGRYVGANGLVYLGWSVGTLSGVLLAGLIPDSPQIAFVGVLAILALVGPMLASPVGRGVALVAVAVAALGHDWPWRLGTFAAIFAGVAATLWLGRERGGDRGRGAAGAGVR